jgi:protein MpaA
MFGMLRGLTACLAVAGCLFIAGCAATQPKRQPGPVEPSVKPPHTAAPMPARPSRRTAPAPAPPTARGRRVVLGKSVAGAPLEMFVFGDGRPVLLIFAGIHGNEPSSVFVAQRLLETLRAEPTYCARRTVAVLPNVNPDAHEKRRRTNLNRVDLNRNFPASNFKPHRLYGSKPASQPETRAIIRAVESLRPDAIVSIHAIGRGRQCNNYDGPARELAGLLGRYNGYPVREHIGYSTPGSFGTWAGKDLGIPTITLELPRGRRAPRIWERNRPALLALLRADFNLLAK